jgi:hypothetical protein
MNRSRSLSYFPVCAFKPGLACFRARHIAAVLSLPSEELTAIDGKSPLSTFQHPLPVDGFHRTKPFSFVRIQLLQIKNESCLLRTKLVLLFADLLTVPFACECFLHAFLLAWFQVKGVALDLFDNVLRLHLPLETTKSILQGLAFLNTNFCQDEIHLQTCLIGYLISILPTVRFSHLQNRSNPTNSSSRASVRPNAHPPKSPPPPRKAPAVRAGQYT